MVHDADVLRAWIQKQTGLIARSCNATGPGSQLQLHRCIDNIGCSLSCWNGSSLWQVTLTDQGHVGSFSQKNP